MKIKTTTAFLGACALASAASAQVVPQLRIVLVDNSGNPTGITNDTGSESVPIGSSYDGVFYLQIALFGDPNVNGVTTFAALLNDGGLGGTFAAETLSLTEQGIIFPGSDMVPSMDNGTFANFRTFIAQDNSNPGNGGSGSGIPTEVPTGSSLAILPLDLTSGGRGEGEGEWINVYKFRYTHPNVNSQIAINARFNPNVGDDVGYWTTRDDGMGGMEPDFIPLGGPLRPGNYVIPAPSGAIALGTLAGLVLTRRRR